MKIRKSYLKFVLGAMIAAMAFTQPSQAWENDLTIYAWGAGVTGTATLNGQTGAPTEIDFDEIIEKLEMAFMAHYEGIEEAWGFGADYTYIGLGDTNDLGVTGDLDATIAEAFAIYRPNAVFDVLAGVRYTGLDLAVEGPGVVTANGDRSLTDLYVGGRFFLPFSETWTGALRADVGAGDSDLTWNVVAAVDWQVSSGTSLRGGYRWLGYEVDKDDARVSNQLDLTFDGPFLAIAFQW